MIIISENELFLNVNWNVKLIFIIIIITANKRILDAIACVRKYFKEASEDFKLLLSLIRGMKANKLISRPIHTLSHELAVTANSVPETNTIKNNIFDVFFIIKKKRIEPL